jgi:hypothetical protein
LAAEQQPESPASLADRSGCNERSRTIVGSRVPGREHWTKADALEAIDRWLETLPDVRAAYDRRWWERIDDVYRRAAGELEQLATERDALWQPLATEDAIVVHPWDDDGIDRRPYDNEPAPRRHLAAVQ